MLGASGARPSGARWEEALPNWPWPWTGVDSPCLPEALCVAGVWVRPARDFVSRAVQFRPAQDAAKPGGTTSARGNLRFGSAARDAILIMPAVIRRLPAAPRHAARRRRKCGSFSSALWHAARGSRPANAVRGLTRADVDGIRGGFGPDVDFLDGALEKVFGMVAVDPTRLALGGFSDGATYALSLGLVNGDLFQRIVAFSPGFLVDGELHGKPRVFISHGTADDILPIDRCSRLIVPDLQKRGYDVTFKEFEGGHEVPPAIAAEGFSFVRAS